MVHPKTHIIVSDLDGCLVDIYQELQKHLWDLYSVWVPVDTITDYRVDEPIWEYLVSCRPRSVFVPPESFVLPQFPEFREVLSSFWSEPKGYLQAKPYHWYWQALVDWYWTGGATKFITARPKPVHEATVAWLLSWGLMMGPDVLDRNVVFTERGPHDSGIERVAYIRQIQEQTKLKVVFIDDRRETCEEVKQALGDDVIVILPKRPWNAFPNHQNLHRVRRMSDEQIAPLISMV